MTSKVVALHNTGKTFTDRSARHIDLLAGDEMLGKNLRAYFEKVIRRNAEFRYFRLRLNFSLREMTAQSLSCVLYLGKSNAKLNSRITVFSTVR